MEKAKGIAISTVVTVVLVLIVIGSGAVLLQKGRSAAKNQTAGSYPCKLAKEIAPSFVKMVGICGMEGKGCVECEADADCPSGYECQGSLCISPTKQKSDTYVSCFPMEHPTDFWRCAWKFDKDWGFQPYTKNGNCYYFKECELKGDTGVGGVDLSSLSCEYITEKDPRKYRPCCKEPNQVPSCTVSGWDGCKSVCSPPKTYCYGECVNLQTDRNNCGECGRICSADKTCLDGTCSGCTEDSNPSDIQSGLDCSEGGYCDGNEECASQACCANTCCGSEEFCNSSKTPPQCEDVSCDNNPSGNQGLHIEEFEQTITECGNAHDDDLNLDCWEETYTSCKAVEGPLNCFEGKRCDTDLECAPGLFCNESKTPSQCENIACDNNPDSITSGISREVSKWGWDGKRIYDCSRETESCQNDLSCAIGETCDCHDECESGSCKDEDGDGVKTCVEEITCAEQPDGECDGGALSCDIREGCDCNAECAGRGNICVDADNDGSLDTCADKKGIEYNPPGCNEKLEVWDWGNGESWYDEADCEEECASGLTYREEENTCVLICDGKVCSAACRRCDDGSCTAYTGPVITAADGDEEEGPVCKCIENCGGGHAWYDPRGWF